MVIFEETFNNLYMYKGVVYSITHRETQRVYIGQTRDLRKRIWQHKTSANNANSKNEGQPIVKAIREYGINAFDIDVVYESPAFDDLKTYKAHMNAMEIFYIEKYDSISSGYNLTKGGAGLLGYRLPEEAIEKAAAAKRGKKISEEHKDAVRRSSYKLWEKEGFRQMMSERMSGYRNPMYGVRLEGEKNHNYGKPMSEETKRKLSLAHKGKKGKPLTEEHKEKLRKAYTGVPKSEEHRRKISESLRGRPNTSCWKSILQYSLTGEFIKEWSSITEAQEYYNTKHISMCASGKRNQAAGYIWTYKQSDSIPLKIDIPENKGFRRIAQIDENGAIVKTFKSIREASRELSLNYSGISSVLQGAQKKTGGCYRFIYLE